MRMRTVYGSGPDGKFSITEEPLASPIGSEAPPLRQRRRRTEAATSQSRLLSAQGAAEYLGVPYTSLRDWALRGHVPIVRVPDCRRLWFDRKDLDRLVEQWKERTDP